MTIEPKEVSDVFPEHLTRCVGRTVLFANQRTQQQKVTHPEPMLCVQDCVVVGQSENEMVE